MEPEEVLEALHVLEAIEEAEEQAAVPRCIWHCENPFNLPPNVFKKFFRVTPELARLIIQIVTPFVPEATRRSALSVERKTLCTLRFLASGSYQAVIGTNLFTAISQASVSRALHQICDALCNPAIFNQWIHFPRNLQEMEALRNGFYNKYQFPGVIGCIDCTHVAIVAPKVNDPNHPEHIYINRKNYHSINTQLICDHNLRILNINARFPGSAHDAHIWRQSEISLLMEQLYRRNRNNNFFLLGDSGYPLRPWLLTPMRNVEPGSPEERMNERFMTIRSIVERCNGILKNRWRCLLKHRVLHYSPTTAGKIINACSVLHNMCIEHNIPEHEEDAANDMDFGIYDIPYYENGLNEDIVVARRLQQHIAQQHFNNLQ